MRSASRWNGLSARLLLLTVVFVMLAEVLIYAPSAGRYRLMYLEDRLSDGHLAATALEAAPYGELQQPLKQTLLRHAGVHSVELRLGNLWTRMLGSENIPEPNHFVDLRQHSFFPLIWDAVMTLVHGEDRILQVTGPSPMNPAIRVEIIMDEAPMRAALIDYSYRIMQLSLLISVITAALVYLSLQLMIVHPMSQLTESMVRFRERPEDETVDVEATRRSDEIGLAQRVLADMQTGLRQALTQRSHLAGLGEAVVKINHDLRNILSSAQLVSDRLAKSEDPTVRATSSVLMQAIDRAVGLCSQVVLYSQARRPSLKLESEQLFDLLEEAGDNVLALNETQPDAGVWHWQNNVPPMAYVRADRAQLLRVVENISRNAYEAGASLITVDASNQRQRWIIHIEDNGPGLPERVQDTLFQPFKTSNKVGGTGLGLAIAREIAVSQGGRLYLDKTGQSGTRFVLEVPAASQNTDQRRISA